MDPFNRQKHNHFVLPDCTKAVLYGATHNESKREMG